MRILTVGSSIESWSETHDLPCESDNCPKCGVERVANIPFASNGVRGFMSDVHDCGERYRLRVFRVVGSEKQRWAELSQQD